MKNWILNLGFVKEAINLASVQGTDFGIEQGKDKIEMLSKLNEDVLERRSNEKLAKLLGAVDENFVVTYDKKTGLVFMGGVKLDEYQIMNLKSEAEAIAQMQIWKTLSETLKQQAQKTIFENSTEWADVMNGKMMLYNLSLQQKILDIFRNYKPKAKS